MHGGTAASNAGDIIIGRTFETLVLDNPCTIHCGAFDPFALVAAPSIADGVPDSFVNEGGSIIGSAEVGRGGDVVITADNFVNNGVIQADPDAASTWRRWPVSTGPPASPAQYLSCQIFVIVPDTDFRSMCEAQRAASRAVRGGVWDAAV